MKTSKLGRIERMDKGIQKKVLDQINEEEVVQFAMDLTDVYSPTGFEADASRFCFDEFSRLGLRAKLQEISDGRFNALGELPGTGGGRTLMFNGHMDISYTEMDLQLVGGENTLAYRQNMGADQVRNKSTLEDGWIYGNGVRNMKSAMAAYVGAVAAIMRTGVKLKGDIIIAAVCGEIEKAPVDGYTGREYLGYGEGSRFLVTHGGVADGCILGEPSKLQVIRGNCGTVWLKLSTPGELSHTAWCDQVDNSIEAMTKLIVPLREWIDRYRESNQYLGTTPQVNISSIQGGWPWRMSRTPTYCNLYLDVRYIPGLHPLQIKEEIKNVVAKAQARNPKLEVEIEILVSMPPAETSKEDPVVQAVIGAHRQVFGQEPEESFKGVYTDASHMTSYGIPSVIYGPAGRNKLGVPEYVYGWQCVEDLVNATRVYALAALDYCMGDRKL
jgi:acetylornithine deacetylase